MDGRGGVCLAPGMPSVHRDAMRGADACRCSPLKSHRWLEDIDWITTLQSFQTCMRAVSPASGICTNGDSQWAARARITTITRCVVARCTTRCLERVLDAELPGLKPRPPLRCFSRDSSWPGGHGTVRTSVCAAGCRSCPTNVQPSRLIGRTPSANRSADTVKRCTRKRCRGGILAQLPAMCYPQTSSLSAQSSGVGVLGLISIRNLGPNIAQTDRLDLKPAREMTVNRLKCGISCQPNSKVLSPHRAPSSYSVNSGSS